MEQSRPSNKARVFKIAPKPEGEGWERFGCGWARPLPLPTEDIHETVARIHRYHCTADKLNNMNKVLETES